MQKAVGYFICCFLLMAVFLYWPSLIDFFIFIGCFVLMDVSL